MAFLAATNAVVAAYSAVSASLSSPHLPVPLTAASTDLMWIMKLSLEPRPVQDRIEVLTPVLSLYETRWEFGSESLSAMGMDGIWNVLSFFEVTILGVIGTARLHDVERMQQSTQSQRNNKLFEGEIWE